MGWDVQEAIRLLEEYRRSVAQQRAPSRFSRKPSEGVYTSQEINHVLTQVIDRNGSSDLVDALLRMGGDVNVSRRKSTRIWNVIRRKDQQPERNDILLKAATNSPPEVVGSLASRADQANLNNALRLAIMRGDVAVVKALLVHGADPADLHEAFQHTVLQNGLGIVEALLSGAKKPCHPCCSSALVVAVRNQSSEALRVLMKSGADPNHDSAASLLAAAQAKRPDLLAILLSGPSWPSPQSLDAVVGHAYATMTGKDTSESVEVIDMALSAAAQGQHTTDLCSKGFAETVRTRQIGLLDILLKHSRPSGHHEAVAILQAIEIGDTDSLAKFLGLHPAPTSLAVAVSQALKVTDRLLRLEIMKMLISSGAQGECIASALVSAVESVLHTPDQKDQVATVDRELLDLLLDNGNADVDYRSGEALQAAVKASSLDISRKMIAKGPSPDTLGAVLPVALSIADSERRESMVELLMGNEISDLAVSRSLTQVVKGGRGNSYLVQLLLSRANVDHNSGEVFVHAIRNKDLNTLQLLLLRHPNSTSLSTVVDVALKVDKKTRHGVFEVMIPHLDRKHLDQAFRASGLEPYPNLDFIRMLLQAGANVAVDHGVCIRQAARNLDIDGLILFTEFSGYNEAIYTAAFTELLESGTNWMSFDHLDVMQLILTHGAASTPVNSALHTVIQHLGCDKSQTVLMENILEMLLASDADVNYEKGAAVRLAARQGNAVALRLLLASGATTDTASAAFHTAIIAEHSEEPLLELVDIFTNGKNGDTFVDVNKAQPGMLPPLFLCIDAYPNSVALAARLFAAGCDPEQTVQSRVYGETKDLDAVSGMTIPEEEPVTILAWALLQPNYKISSDVVCAIIDQGANVSYATPKARAAPLMLAANFGRVDVVQKLLDSGAKPAAKDVFGRSALFYASRSGNPHIVKLLLERKPVVNDGSLHEASRGFHAPVMELLIAGGHDPNFRSTKHGGRTALGEMAFKGRVPVDISVAEEAVDVLKAAGADPLLQTLGKSVVYLAMENPRPVPMTQLLLEKLLWQTIDSEANMYQSGDLHYSPTTYLSKTPSHPSRSFRGQLLTLLHHHGARDVFYSSSPNAPQPPGAVGLPTEIAAAESRRLAREAAIAEQEQLHHLALRREAEAHIHQLALAESSHTTSLRHRHASAGLDIAIADASHASATNRTLSSHVVEREIGWDRHDDEMAKTWQKAALGSQIAYNTASVNRGIDRDQHNDDMAMTWQKAALGSQIAVDTAHTNRGIAWDRHRDKLDMSSEHRESDLSHRSHVHDHLLSEREDEESQAYTFREAKSEQAARLDDGRHSRNLRYLADHSHATASQQARMDAIDITHRHAVSDSEIRHMRNRGWVDEENARALNAVDLEHAASRARGRLVYHRHKADISMGYARDLHGLEGERHGMRMVEQRGEMRNIAGQVNLREWAAWKGAQGQGQVQGQVGAGWRRGGNSGNGAIGWEG